MLWIYITSKNQLVRDMDMDGVLVLGAYIKIRKFITLFIWELKGWCNYWNLSHCKYVVKYFCRYLYTSLCFFAVVIVNLTSGYGSSWWVAVFFYFPYLEPVSTISVAIKFMIQWSFRYPFNHFKVLTLYFFLPSPLSLESRCVCCMFAYQILTLNIEGQGEYFLWNYFIMWIGSSKNWGSSMSRGDFPCISNQICWHDSNNTSLHISPWNNKLCASE